MQSWRKTQVKIEGGLTEDLDQELRFEAGTNELSM